MTMWESVIYWTKKLLFAIAALLYICYCFPSSWLLEAPPSPSDKFTYFIIVTIIIAYCAINNKLCFGKCGRVSSIGQNK
jgi:hypothetical protein